MSLLTPPNRFTAASIFRAGLFVLFFLGFLQPVALKADPIVFQATTLRSTGCGASVSGDNFSFDGIFESLGNGCGGRIANVGIDWPDPGQPLPCCYDPVVTGYVNVPGGPGRLAVAYGGGQPSLYKDPEPTYVPDSFTGEILVNVVLTGTVQVCLEPANVQTPGEVVACDPAYANFGVININVAGQAAYEAYDGAVGARDFLGFTGTSAAAPEPAQLGLAGAAALLLWAVAAQTKARRHADG